MPAQTDRPRTDTAQDILDIAEMLIQTRGYNAFSYQDIADHLGIRKASIHYHFRSKNDLGVAVVERYAGRIEVALAAIAADPALTALQMFEAYTGPYIEFAGTPDRICLCGALAGEILALPVEVREVVERTFTAHQCWLTNLLERGVARGEFSVKGAPQQMARAILGALQGALLVKRVTGDQAQMHDVIGVLKSQLLAMPESGG